MHAPRRYSVKSAKMIIRTEIAKTNGRWTGPRDGPYALSAVEEWDADDEAAGGDNSAGSEEREDEDEDGEEEEEGDEPPAPKALVEFDEASVAADSPPQLSRTLKQWVGRVDAIERKVNEWVAVSKKMDPDVCARLIAEFEGLKQSTNELKTRLIARNTPSADEISAHESNLLKHRNAWVDAGYCRETRKDAQDRGVATTNAMSSSRNCVPRTGINALLIMRPNVHISNKEESGICGTMVRTAHKRAMVAANNASNATANNASKATADPTIADVECFMGKYGIGMRLHNDYRYEVTALTLFMSCDVCFVRVELTYVDGTADKHCFLYDGRPRNGATEQRGELIDARRSIGSRIRKFHHLLLDHEDERTKEDASARALLDFFNDDPDDPVVARVELLDFYHVYDANEAVHRKAEKAAQKADKQLEKVARAAQKEWNRREDAARRDPDEVARRQVRAAHDKVSRKRSR